MEYATLSDAEKYGGGLYAVRETFPDTLTPADEYLKKIEDEERGSQEEVVVKIEGAEDPISLLRKQAKELGVKSWHVLSVENLKKGIEEKLAAKEVDQPATD